MGFPVFPFFFFTINTFCFFFHFLTFSAFLASLCRFSSLCTTSSSVSLGMSFSFRSCLIVVGLSFMLGSWFIVIPLYVRRLCHPLVVLNKCHILLHKLSHHFCRVRTLEIARPIVLVILSLFLFSFLCFLVCFFHFF